jgi:hypothetical protein
MLNIITNKKRTIIKTNDARMNDIILENISTALQFE